MDVKTNSNTDNFSSATGDEENKGGYTYCGIPQPQVSAAVYGETETVLKWDLLHKVMLQTSELQSISSILPWCGFTMRFVVTRVSYR